MGESSSTDVSDEAILTVFAETEASTLRPSEVASDLPVTAETLRGRFEELSELGLLRRDEDRRSGTAWHLTDEGRSRLDDADGEVSTDVEAQATATGTGAAPRDQETTESPPPEPGEATAGPPYEPPGDLVEAFDPPGTPDQKEKRRAALRGAYEYLRDRGRASRSEFVDDVFPDFQGAYEEPDDGWWEEVVRPGLERLPGPEPVGDDAWRFDEQAGTRSGDE